MSARLQEGGAFGQRGLVEGLTKSREGWLTEGFLADRGKGYRGAGREMASAGRLVDYGKGDSRIEGSNVKQKSGTCQIGLRDRGGGGSQVSTRGGAPRRNPKTIRLETRILKGRSIIGLPSPNRGMRNNKKTNRVSGKARAEKEGEGKREDH